MSQVPRPPGHHSITPSFVVPDSARVIDFMLAAFDGQVVDRYDGPNGSVMHAEVMVGDSVVMLGDCPPGTAPMPAVLSYYVADGPAVDATYARALAAGATTVTAPKDQFYGYRSACLTDCGGNRWTICAVIEVVSPEEMQQRMAALMAGPSA